MVKKVCFRFSFLSILCSFSLAAALILILGDEVNARHTTRVSVGSSGNQGNDHSTYPAISSGGRYVAFRSSATNLVAGDTNGYYDIFVHDRQTGITTRVSVDSSGTESNSYSDDPAISSAGRYVAFTSTATNLVAGDTNEDPDVFVHDRQTAITTRVSVDSSGIQGNDRSLSPAISADGGRYVAFDSSASNLVAGDTNGYYDIFVHDRQTGITTRVSVGSSGIQGNRHSYHPAISSAGRYVAFDSWATNLVAGDTNGDYDIFVHDRQTGITTRVSVDSSGIQGNDHSTNPALSSDGRYVAFRSDATNLVAGDTNGYYDVFVHDRQTGITTRVSVGSSGIQGNDSSFSPAISADGRYVAFRSDATNLVAGDTNGDYDVFVHDRQTGITTRVSVDSSGTESNSYSDDPALSSDGRYVAFKSWATNLVAGDTNERSDIFIRDTLFIDIKANGSDRAIEVASGTNVSVTISLIPGDEAGQNADWWVAENAPDGWQYYDVIGGSWSFLPGLSVTHQGPLFDFASFTVLNTSSLPVGTYTFYFGVDMNMNGSLDFDQLSYDSIVVNVTE